MTRQVGWIAAVISGVVVAWAPAPVLGCPFCEVVSQTFLERIEISDVAVVAELISKPDSDQPPEGAGGPAEKSSFRIERIFKGESHLKGEDKVAAYYYGESEPGSMFLLLATIEKKERIWSAPVPVSQRAIEYIAAGQELPDSPPERLAFFQDYLEDEDSQLAQDAYDEFARAPYDVLIAMKEHMDRERLKKWIRDPEVTANHRRLYLTMLGVCGTDEDVPLLEERLAAHKSKTPSGLDALVACYLILKGPDGLPLIEDRFLKNREAEFTDTYAAITALRFIGEQTDSIPRARVAESFHHMLDRPDLADLVIRDLARWEDWSVVPRMVALFRNADEKSSWVRQPVARYLMVCPLPEAKQHLKELRSIDAEAIDRAGSVLALLGGRGRDAVDQRNPADKEDDDSDSADDGGTTGEGGDGASSKEKQGDEPDGDEPEDAKLVGDRADESSGKGKSKKDEPPTYLVILGIPAIAGLVLFGVMWLVLSGAGSRSWE